ncbi:N-(5'-phosphoribosyl)anthranilate isomerase [Marimonas sp. MJW-29]|uniref:N-(5'-phosphoribosyl)anthranilate isomerase n=1 Tax=Sulfitobacter sediminis TaxID=3234186 RepID=A0ABV3RIK5_9RHOB
MTMPAALSPEHWITHGFSAKAAREGGVVRRKIRDIERYVGLEVFLAELDRRGFTAVENAGQLVIFCNQEPVRVVSRTISLQRPLRSF